MLSFVFVVMMSKYTVYIVLFIISVFNEKADQMPIVILHDVKYILIICMQIIVTSKQAISTVTSQVDPFLFSMKSIIGLFGCY